MLWQSCYSKCLTKWWLLIGFWDRSQRIKFLSLQVRRECRLTAVCAGGQPMWTTFAARRGFAWLFQLYKGSSRPCSLQSLEAMKSEWRRSFKWCRNMFKTLRCTQLDLTLWEFARCFWHPVLVDLIPSGVHRMKKARAENHMAACKTRLTDLDRSLCGSRGQSARGSDFPTEPVRFQRLFDLLLLWFGVWTPDQMPLFSESINYILKHLEVFVFWCLRPDFRELYTFGSLIGEGVRIPQRWCIWHSMTFGAKSWDRPRISVSSTLAMSN